MMWSRSPRAGPTRTAVRRQATELHTGSLNVRATHRLGYAVRGHLLFGMLIAAWPMVGHGRDRANTDFAQLVLFQCDVTPPVGHPCMGGGIEPVKEVLDPLWAQGVVLTVAGQPPVALVAVDWCEIRNEAYDRWREAIAKAAATTPDRVLLASVHQHDAPVADLQAERLLRERKLQGSVCDLDFHEATVRRVADALRQAMARPRRVTHYGVGAAPVEGVASNRRFTTQDGRLAFSRTSSSQDPQAHAADEGLIDPLLRTLSFWDGDQPLAAVHAYAVHPMAYYGRGQVSADFPGLARRLRLQDLPGVQQIYFSGASGNVTAGKYNDGAPTNRALLAERLRQAMRQAWDATQRIPLTTLEFRSAELRLPPRASAGFAAADSLAALVPESAPFKQCLAAMNLSWRERTDANRSLQIPAVDLGQASVVLLPGESYVEYQLFAQALRPDRFVFTVGYGECATGYIPTEQHWRENDTNLGDWCWVAPGAEPIVKAALRQALNADSETSP